MDAVGEKLLDVAKAELGYTEKASGYTKFGDWYAQHVAGGDSYYATAPWCDMFLAWAADRAGVDASTGKFAATIDHAKWFKEHNAFGTTAEPGAIAFFAWSGGKSLDDIEHVGLVEKVSDSTLHTIEANTGGGTLMRRTRDVSQVVGYGYPGKVKVAAPAPVQAASIRTASYLGRHAAPPQSADAFLRDTANPVAAANATYTVAEPARPSHDGSPLAGYETVLSGIVTLLLCGSLALAVGKATAAKVPAPSVPEIRVRKRGKHHRTAAPVALPADIGAADFDGAEAGTVVMPALTAAAAQQAEDHIFWGKIAQFEDDEELAFWSDLHDALTHTPPVSRTAVGSAEGPGAGAARSDAVRSNAVRSGRLRSDGLSSGALSSGALRSDGLRSEVLSSNVPRSAVPRFDALSSDALSSDALRPDALGSDVLSSGGLPVQGRRAWEMADAGA